MEEENREVEVQHRYRVEVIYDMGMSGGGETHEFSAKDDAAARKYIEEHTGGNLSPIKRGVKFIHHTLARVIG